MAMPRQKNYQGLIKRLPFIRNFLKKLDEHIEKHGIQEGMSNLISWTNTRIIAEGLTPQLKRILESEPAIVVANHDFQAEVLVLLASLPSRKNTYLIANDEFLGVFPHLDQHIIPVHIKHRAPKNKKEVLLLKLLNYFHPSPRLNESQAHQQNIQSIKTASIKVDAGNLVIIFPEARGIEGKWKPGIGYLLNGVTAKRKSYFIQAYIQGTLFLDYLRLIPFVGKILPSYKISFAQPLNIKDIVEKNAEPKRIVSLLEDQYKTWVDSIIEKPKTHPLAWGYAHKLRLVLQAIILFLKTNS
jgi:1-acyl-sn-glycerol-3-phosphate acyltransferase